MPPRRPPYARIADVPIARPMTNFATGTPRWPVRCGSFPLCLPSRRAATIPLTRSSMCPFPFPGGRAPLSIRGTCASIPRRLLRRGVPASLSLPRAPTRRPLGSLLGLGQLWNLGQYLSQVPVRIHHKMDHQVAIELRHPVSQPSERASTGGNLMTHALQCPKCPLRQVFLSQQGFGSRQRPLQFPYSGAPARRPSPKSRRSLDRGPAPGTPAPRSRPSITRRRRRTPPSVAFVILRMCPRRTSARRSRGRLLRGGRAPGRPSKGCQPVISC